LEERASCLATYKPTGWASHALSAWDTKRDVSRWLLQQRPDLRGIGEERAPGLLHRLDNPTSGLLLFAASPSRYHQLIQARQERLWCKLYLAKVGGYIPSSQTLSNKIIHHPTKKKLMQLDDPALPSSLRSRPQEAITHLVPIDYDPEVDQTLLLLRIETGVRHQIRLHLASKGNPILGDALYSGSPASRLYLHAWALSVPSSSQGGDHLLFVAPIPRDFLF
jgi:23S rRNA-/tRNA-specific pseudouridylate synthase